MSASGLIGPPLDIPAERLFRLLLRSPRASLPVVLPIAGAEHGAFFVRALHPLDEAEVYDNAPTGPAEVRRSVIGAGLAALALHDGSGRRLFESGDALLSSLYDNEAARLIVATLQRLWVVSPSYVRCDYTAWTTQLVLGANHPTNAASAVALASCVDPGWRTEAPRPDRFYGIPVGDLTDGQWMAFRAARRAIVESKNDND